MMGAYGAPQKRSVDAYNPPKGFFVLGAPQANVLEINLYDTVTWNIMEGEHTITPDDSKKWGDEGSDTLESADSGTYIAKNFKVVGDYTYYCKIHENMTGIVRVKDNAPSSAAAAAPAAG